MKERCLYRDIYSKKVQLVEIFECIRYENLEIDGGGNGKGSERLFQNLQLLREKRGFEHPFIRTQC